LVSPPHLVVAGPATNPDWFDIGEGFFERNPITVRHLDHESNERESSVPIQGL